jgi:hypothetical protein
MPLRGDKKRQGTTMCEWHQVGHDQSADGTQRDNPHFDGPFVDKEGEEEEYSMIQYSTVDGHYLIYRVDGGGRKCLIKQCGTLISD